MKIKFLKDYAINRGDCPLEIGGFAALETEIVKADTVVDLEKDNRDDAFSDELVRWLIDNGFAEEAKESGWWKPKLDEMYYFVNGYGSVWSDTWDNLEGDRGKLAIGEVFKTEGAAERYRDYLKAIATVRQDEGVLTPERINERIKNEDLAYYVGYMGNRSNGEALCGCTMSFEDCWMPVGAILFDSEVHADRSLDKHPDEWKAIANYDWSRE